MHILVTDVRIQAYVRQLIASEKGLDLDCVSLDKSLSEYGCTESDIKALALSIMQYWHIELDVEDFLPPDCHYGNDLCDAIEKAFRDNNRQPRGRR